ncbi:replication protein A 14 kDa subunit B [Cymbomonas tetramitiformis]|uniref:Replication protein A 14 kDa subunit B n=1 Tax=Cymbomonas tetramitiformis TaxID=36881 RepID=A0AAE0KV95_9CHLO|nr:replication protein A 14 kDa subunit B [Cymbomonas tetramitiformis]
MMQVSAADGVGLAVRLAPGGDYNTEFLEFEGIVEDSGTIREEVHTNFGNSFDMESYNELCKLSNAEHKHLFCD